MKSNTKTLGLYTVWGLYIVTAVMIAFVRPVGFQWDFFVFYDAGLSARYGTSPFDFASLAAFGVERHAPFQYTYLPGLMYLFLPFAYLTPPVAASLWFLLKCAMLVHIFKMLQRIFPLNERSPGTLLFFYFAFNGALIWDLVCGNTSVLQMWLLWLGFTWFLADRFWLFAGAVIAAAVFKLQPIFFLVLLIVPAGPARWKEFFGGLAGFAAVLLANKVFFPTYFEQFLREAGGRLFAEVNIMSPSSLMLSHNVSYYLGWIIGGFSVGWNNAITAFLYSLMLLALVAGSAKLLLSRRLTRVELIMFFSLVFLAAVPRVKNYDFILAIPAALFVLRRQANHLIPLFALLFCVPHVFGSQDMWTIDIVTSPFLGPVKKPIRLFFEFAPLLGVWLAWWLFAKTDESSHATK